MESDRLSISIEDQEHMKFAIWVSFGEIYNEQVFDLLEAVSKSRQKRSLLEMKEDKNGNPYIKGVSLSIC